MFKVHGYYTISNAGGYEIELSDCGDAARVRDAYGSEEPEVSEWYEIEYVIDSEEPEGDLVAVIDPDGHNIPLNQVMRANF